MKKLFALLIVLLLAACSGPALQKLPEAPIAPLSSPPAATTQPETMPVIDYSMTAETRGKLMEVFTGSTKYAVSETYVQLSPGSHHTFGVAFTNRFADKDQFLVDVKFKKAYDKGTNTIDGVTSVQVAPWLAQNDLSVTVLQPNDQSIQEVVIEATKFANGANPPKGTYVFSLNVFHKGDYIQVDQPVSGEIELNVQVV